MNDIILFSTDHFIQGLRSRLIVHNDASVIVHEYTSSTGRHFLAFSTVLVYFP